MAQRIAVWYGTDEDLYKLKKAVAHNCDCPVSASEDPRPPTCAAHEMLADQDILNHLVFVARQRRRYQRGEFAQARIRPCRLCGQFHIGFD